MGNITTFNDIINTKYGNESFDSLIVTYRKLTEEYSAFSDSINDASVWSRRFSGVMFKGVAGTILAHADHLTASAKDGFSVVLINLLLMIQVTKLLLDKAPQNKKDALNKEIEAFVKGSGKILKYEFQDTIIPGSDRVELMKLLDTVINHPNCAVNSFVKKTFSTLSLSLIKDCRADVLVNWMSEKIYPEIDVFRNKFHEELKSIPNLKDEHYALGWHRFHMETLPLKFQELTAVQVNEMVDFVLAHKTEACAPLMQKLEAMYQDVRDKQFKSAGPALFCNAIVRVASDAAEKMKKHLKHDDVKWLETAKLYDTSYLYSQRHLEDSHARKWNSLIIIAVMGIPTAMYAYFDRASQTEDEHHQNPAMRATTVLGMCAVAAACCWKYEDHDEQFYRPMKFPDRTASTMTLTVLYNGASESSASSNNNRFQGVKRY